MTTIQVSDQAYQRLLQAAQERQITPEQLIEDFAHRIAQPSVYLDEIAFFRALGATDDDLIAIDKLASQLPEHPNW